MPAYDAARFTPPASVAFVTIRNPETGDAAMDVPMLIDTGADVTLVPRAVLARVGGSTLAGVQYELVSFDGTTSYAEVTQIEMTLCRRRFRGQYLLTDDSVGVVGRNVLNALTPHLATAPGPYSGRIDVKRPTLGALCRTSGLQ